MAFVLPVQELAADPSIHTQVKDQTLPASIVSRETLLSCFHPDVSHETF